MARTMPIENPATDFSRSSSTTFAAEGDSFNAERNLRGSGFPLSTPLSPWFVNDVIKGCDVLLLSFLSYAAYLLHPRGTGPSNSHLYIVGTALGMVLWATISRSAELYCFPPLRLKRRLIKTMLCWCAAIAPLLSVAVAMSRADAKEYGSWLIIWSTGGLMALTISHLIAVGHVSVLTRAGHLLRAIVVLGAGDLGCRVAEHIEKGRAQGLRVAGVFDDRTTRVSQAARERLCGNFTNALAFIRRCKVDCVILALPLHAETRIMELVRHVTEAPVDVYLAPDAIGFHFFARSNPNIGGLPVIAVAEKPIKEWKAVLKSIEDKVIAVGALILLAPMLAVLAIAIKLDGPGPVLFRQPRCGFNEKLFHVYKFRTMYVEASDMLGDRLVVRGDRRVTKVGRLLRRTSLDELPQLFNVLLGQMSIVGPRPHPVNAKAANLPYSEVVTHYAARHRVKPGITGWAQINGWRGETDTYEKIEKRVQHDLYYIENWSVAFDLWIILVTFFRGFYHKEAY